MPGFDGTGPAGMGPMTGGGRGFCSPLRSGVRGYGGRRLYRGWHGWQSRHPYNIYNPPQLTREEEIEFLRNEADTIKSHLDEIELRIKDLDGAA